jgi:hypothetical protein
MKSLLSSSLLGLLPFGIAVLNVRARILFTNTYASEFLRASPDLHAPQGGLQSRSAAHKRVLSEALNKFACPDAAPVPIGFSIARTEKSLRVLKPGGKLISISGPPDPEFAKDLGSTWILRD